MRAGTADLASSTSRLCAGDRASAARRGVLSRGAPVGHGHRCPAIGRRPEPQGIELRIPTTDDELYGMAVVQAEAYDEPGVPSRDIVARRRAALADGALAVVAVDRTTGAVVGAGSCSPVSDGLAEVAAIGVSVTYRRRGIGGALATCLGREALSAGADVPWLMAAHDSERRIYERAGYRVIGEILHISR